MSTGRSDRARARRTIDRHLESVAALPAAWPRIWPRSSAWPRRLDLREPPLRVVDAARAGHQARKSWAERRAPIARLVAAADDRPGWPPRRRWCCRRPSAWSSCRTAPPMPAAGRETLARRGRAAGRCSLGQCLSAIGGSRVAAGRRSLRESDQGSRSRSRTPSRTCSIPKRRRRRRRTSPWIDQAISESRAALRAEPASEPARESLIESFKAKMGLLQDTVALINEMRKGNDAGAARIVSGLKQKGDRRGPHTSMQHPGSSSLAPLQLPGAPAACWRPERLERRLVVTLTLPVARARRRRIRHDRDPRLVIRVAGACDSRAGDGSRRRARVSGTRSVTGTDRPVFAQGADRARRTV